MLLSNYEAEAAALMSMLVDEKACKIAVRLLKTEMFDRDVNRAIFAILKRMHEAGEDIHPSTVIDELKRRDIFPDPSDAAKYVMSVIESDAVSYLIEDYCQAVIDAWQRRQIVKACYAASECARNNPDDIGISIIADLLQNMRANVNLPVLVTDALPQFWEMLERRHKARTVRTGLPTLDSVFPIMGEPAVVVLKGRRGCGKTHFGVWLAYKFIQNGCGVVWYSFEMPIPRLLERVLACWGGVESSVFLQPTDETFSVASYCIACIGDVPLWVCDKRRNAREIMNEVGLLEYKGTRPKLVVVDYMELVPPVSRLATRELELAETISILGDAAQSAGVTVVVLSQVNKEGSERGSEAVGNRADLILELQRDTHDDVRVLRIEKNRYGKDGKLQLKCMLSMSHFEEER